MVKRLEVKIIEGKVINVAYSQFVQGDENPGQGSMDVICSEGERLLLSTVAEKIVFRNISYTRECDLAKINDQNYIERWVIYSS
jgi:hypothetical protein